MLSHHVLALIALCLLGFVDALAEPHTGMVDDEHHREVGLVYTKRDFQGEAKAIFEFKSESECLPLGSPVTSVIICKIDVKCTFYTGTDCNASPDNYAVAVGCGEVDKVESSQDNLFNYYSCVPAIESHDSNVTLKTIPHDSSKDEGAGMGT